MITSRKEKQELDELLEVGRALRLREAKKVAKEIASTLREDIEHSRSVPTVTVMAADEFDRMVANRPVDVNFGEGAVNPQYAGFRSEHKVAYREQRDSRRLPSKRRRRPTTDMVDWLLDLEKVVTDADVVNEDAYFSPTRKE